MELIFGMEKVRKKEN